MRIAVLVVLAVLLIPVGTRAAVFCPLRAYTLGPYRVLPRDTNKARYCTPADFDVVGPEGKTTARLRGVSWREDHIQLRGTTLFWAKSDRSFRRVAVFATDLKTGSTRVVFSRTFVDFLVSPDARRIAITTEQGFALRVYDRRGKQFETYAIQTDEDDWQSLYLLGWENNAALWISIGYSKDLVYGRISHKHVDRYQTTERSDVPLWDRDTATATQPIKDREPLYRN